MSKITLIKQLDGSYVIEAAFNIGEIAAADKPDSKFITMPLGVQAAMQMLNHTLKRLDREDAGWEDIFDSTLEQFCRQWMIDKLGLTQHPLQFNTKGEIEGLKEAYEVKED